MALAVPVGFEVFVVVLRLVGRAGLPGVDLAVGGGAGLELVGFFSGVAVFVGGGGGGVVVGGFGGVGGVACHAEGWMDGGLEGSLTKGED